MLSKFRQLFRFGIVGLTSAAAHFFMVVLLVKLVHLHPLISNIFAFLVAVNVSYWGHRLWTFNHKKHNHSTMLKFLVVSTNSFLLNEGLFAILLKFTNLHYTYAVMIAIGIVAIVTFLFSKLWAFK